MSDGTRVGMNESDYSWDPKILETAFDQDAWASLKQVAEKVSGFTLEDEGIVALVARLPWSTVTGAVSYGVGSVPWKALMRAVGDAASTSHPSAEA